MAYRKTNTTPLIYRKLFSELATSMKNEGWKILYTDASKPTLYTAFAVVDERENTISVGHLFPFNSVFTAEAEAIFQAVEFAFNANEKFIICTDSLSTINMLVNVKNKNALALSIRSMLTERRGMIKIMWIPGHVGIVGNEAADHRAKLAIKISIIKSIIVSISTENIDIKIDNIDKNIKNKIDKNIDNEIDKNIDNKLDKDIDKFRESRKSVKSC